MKPTMRNSFLLSFVMLFAVAATVAGIPSPASAQEGEKVIKITAQKFKYTPNEITVKKGVPVVLEFTSLDAVHGFTCPALKIRTDIRPGKTSTVRFTPDKEGSFPFHCDNFCGTGHGDMTGTITVTP